MIPIYDGELLSTIAYALNTQQYLAEVFTLNGIEMFINFPKLNY